MSSHKLTGTLLEYAAEHIVVCRAHKNANRRVLIETDDEQSWGRLQSKLKSVYGAKEVLDNSGNDLDFSLKFDSEERRDEVVNDINDAIEEYLNANPETPTNYQPSHDEDDDDKETEKTDWTTYIILGAAAAIIIALLLWKK